MIPEAQQVRDVTPPTAHCCTYLDTSHCIPTLNDDSDDDDDDDGTGVHKTFRFKLPTVRRADRRRGIHDGRSGAPPGQSDLESRGSSMDETVPLQPFSPFVDRLRPPSAATRSRPNHDACTVISDPLGVSSGPGGLTEAGRVHAWRCSQGSLRKQSSIEDAGEAAGNGWRLSPAPPLCSRHEPGTTTYI